MLKNVNTYIGTSSGAMISYLLIIGYTPIEIMVYICTHQLLEKMQYFNLISMVQGKGAASFNHILEQLEKMTLDKLGYLPTLGDLKQKHDKTLICVTHNLTTDFPEYLGPENHNTLPCLAALRMSANLPFIFENYKYGNNFYIDGGISNNFAVDIAELYGSKILGIILDNISENDLPSSSVEYMFKLLFIPIKQATDHKISKLSDKFTIVKLTYPSLNFFDFNINSKNKLEMFSIGYQQIKEKLLI